MAKFKLPTKEEARARFWELKSAIDKREAETAKLRNFRDQHVNAARAKEEEFNRQLKAADASVIDGMNMFDAKMDLAAASKIAGNVGMGPDMPIEKVEELTAQGVPHGEIRRMAGLPAEA